MRSKLVAKGFDKWLEREDLEFYQKVENRLHSCDAYKNLQTGISYPHDFSSDVPFEEEYENVKEKYARRIERLISRIKSSRNVLFVYLEPPSEARIEDEEFVRGVSLLREAFPATRVDLLVMSLDENHSLKRPLEREIIPGLFRAEFNYVTQWGRASYLVNESVVAGFLKRNFATTEKYSLSSRLKYAALRREQRYNRYGVSTFFGYAWAKLSYSFRKHLKKAAVQ